MGARVMIAEDEPALQRLLQAYLERAGFTVTCCGNGREALEHIRRDPPDLLLLDLLLPGLDGLSLAEQLRRERHALPIIMVTAKSTEADRIRGLEVGADDYVVKPFSPAEVVLRVQAVLRRVREGQPPSPVLQQGAIVLDRGRHTLTVAGRPVDLTPTEFRLLAALMERPGWTFTRQNLLDLVAGPDFLGFDRNVDVHIANLRKKLGLKPSPIRTVYGVGYRFQPTDP
ncbi:MAG: response regulator transcription factor [Actinomycetia bacterium]|nr:response regulator transcription factor [Actinomycetes bacterium]